MTVIRLTFYAGLVLELLLLETLATAAPNVSGITFEDMEKLLSDAGEACF